MTSAALPPYSVPAVVSDDQQASLLSKTLASARSLVLLQLLSRAVTFTLNFALLRLASPEVFGTASIQFDLIGSTLLFLSREGVRGALLRSSRTAAKSASSKGHDAAGQADRENVLHRSLRQQDLNLSLVPLPIFLGLVAGLVPLYLHYSPASTVDQPLFYPSLGLHLLAYLLEVLSEPYHIRLQSDLRLGVRVQAEGAAVIAKAVGTLLGVWLMRERGALLGFGMGQLAYGAVLLGRFAAAFGLEAGQMWLPRRTSTGTYVDSASFALARAMTQQSLIKHFLTEGDRMLVARLSPLKDQGGYAVATNYGSLVARIIFQPLEETARLYFSKSLRTSQAAPSEPDSAVQTSTTSATATSSAEVDTARMILTTLLRFSTHLLLLLPAFGPPFIPLALSFLLPAARWPPARLQTPREILRIYTLYLPLMSLNGMLEAFFAATAAPSDLARQSRAMVLFSGAFLLTAGGLARALERPEAGLIWANCVNSTCRIAFTFRYARAWFGRRGRIIRLANVTPAAAVAGAIGVSAGLVRASGRHNGDGLSSWQALLRHFSFGAFLGLACLGLIWVNERASLRSSMLALRQKQT